MSGFNVRNFDFYNKIGIATFNSMAVQGGFDTCADLEIAYRHIAPSAAILEIGAGYGRCIAFLLQKKHQGSITAVEQSPVLCRHLRLSYPAPVSIIEGDISIVKIDQPVDAVLWMWSGILDFSKTEQAAVIHALHAVTHPGGRLFIDVPRMGVQTIGEHSGTQHLKFTTGFGQVECYIPREDEIAVYAHEAGFGRVEQHDYATPTAKERTMYMLTK